MGFKNRVRQDAEPGAYMDVLAAFLQIRADVKGSPNSTERRIS